MEKLTGNSSRFHDGVSVELPVGGHCRVNGRLIICMLGKECCNCCFGYGDPVCELEGFRMLCHDYERSDKRSVWFKEIRG